MKRLSDTNQPSGRDSKKGKRKSTKKTTTSAESSQSTSAKPNVQSKKAVKTRKPKKNTKQSENAQELLTDNSSKTNISSDSEISGSMNSQTSSMEVSDTQTPQLEDISSDSGELESSIQAHDAFLEQQDYQRENDYLKGTATSVSAKDSKLTKLYKRGKVVLERLINIIIRPFAPPIPIKKLLLTNEVVVDNVLLVYFTEGQLVLGLILAIIGTYILGLLPFKLLGGLIVLLGIAFFFTASGSEEIYITSSRLLIRRLNLADRLFHIPRDEQYLVKQAVSFQIGRAPVNRIMLGFDFLIILYTVIFSPIYLITIFVYITVIISMYYALRLKKRAISFQMSGGGNVAIGIYKGIPLRFVQNFTETLLSRTLETI